MRQRDRRAQHRKKEVLLQILQHVSPEMTAPVDAGAADVLQRRTANARPLSNPNHS
jgi:hypothetical protein